MEGVITGKAPMTLLAAAKTGATGNQAIQTAGYKPHFEVSLRYVCDTVDSCISSEFVTETVVVIK